MSVKVSVIIPSFNHCKFLKQRIDSVLEQTFQDFEVILLDDASTDNSETVLKPYESHSKVTHLIINKKNSGSPFGLWQKGFDLAQGEYIWIAETDDFAEPKFLEHTVQVLNTNENVTLTYSDSKIINEKGDSLGLWSEHKNTFFKTNRWSNNHSNKGIDEIIDFLLYKVTINNVSAVLFRKKQLLKIDINFLMSFKNVGDLFTYCCVLFEGDIGYVASPLNNYRTHTLNTTKINTNNGTIYKERLQCYNKTLDQLCSKKRDEEYIQKVKKTFKYIIKKNSFSALEFGHKKELFLLLKKLKSYNVFNTFDKAYYCFMFKLHLFNTLKSKQISKSLIKKRTEA